MNKRQQLKLQDTLLIKLLMNGKRDNKLKRKIKKQIKKARKEFVVFDKDIKEIVERFTERLKSSQQNQL